MEIKVKSAHISRIYLNMILQLTPESHCVRSLRVGTSLAHSSLPSFWSHISCFCAISKLCCWRPIPLWQYFRCIVMILYCNIIYTVQTDVHVQAEFLRPSPDWFLVCSCQLIPQKPCPNQSLQKRQRPGQVSSNRSTASVFKALETSGQVPELSIRNLFFVKFLPIR